MAAVVRHLRHQLEVAEAERQLAGSAAERLRSEVDGLKRTIEIQKSQLATEDLRKQRADLQEELFETRRKYETDLATIRESNMLLRCSFSLQYASEASALRKAQEAASHILLKSPVWPQ